MTHILGAYETELAIMRGFFPYGDPSQEPAVTDPKIKSFILNEVGLCLMSLGRLAEAVPFYERHNQIALSMNDHHNASVGYQNLTELYTALGRLEEAEASAGRSLELARQAANKEDERTSLVW